MLLIIAGFLGGILHSIVGIEKYKIRQGRVMNIISSGIIGVISAYSFLGLTNIDIFWVAVIAGYVGTDIIGSLYKIKGVKHG